MSERRALTELEACALAVVWRDGPCSAYAVRRTFETSISSFWSSSAGSIYPAIKRLEALGLIEAAAQPGDKRGSRHLHATRAGAAAVRHWIERFPDAGAPPDPIRTRMFFADALNARARLAFLERAERETRAELEKAEAMATSEEPLFDRLAKLGTLHSLRARLAWLAEVKLQLSKSVAS